MIQVNFSKLDYIEEENAKAFAIYSLTVLYKNKVLNKNQILGRIKSIKQNNHLTRKNVYHFKPLNKWFNNKSMIEIYREITSNYNQTIYLQDLLNMIKLYYGSNQNHAINVFLSEFIDPFVLESLSYYYTEPYCTSLISEKLKIKGFTFKIFDSNDYSFGYCCEDCDGDINEFIDLRMKKDIENEIFRFKESLIAALETYYYTKSYFMNPKRLNVLDLSKELCRMFDINRKSLF